jgi:hypothetical protein
VNLFLAHRPHYRADRDRMSGVAEACPLTQIGPALRGFTFVRCSSSPMASIPHALAGGDLLPRFKLVRLPSAYGCLRLTP